MAPSDHDIMVAMASNLLRKKPTTLHQNSFETSTQHRPELKIDGRFVPFVPRQPFASDRVNAGPTLKGTVEDLEANQSRTMVATIRGADLIKNARSMLPAKLRRIDLSGISRHGSKRLPAKEASFPLMDPPTASHNDEVVSDPVQGITPIAVVSFASNPSPPASGHKTDHVNMQSVLKDSGQISRDITNSQVPSPVTKPGHKRRHILSPDVDTDGSDGDATSARKRSSPHRPRPAEEHEDQLLPPVSPRSIEDKSTHFSPVPGDIRPTAGLIATQRVAGDDSPPWKLEELEFLIRQIMIDRASQAQRMTQVQSELMSQSSIVAALMKDVDSLKTELDECRKENFELLRRYELLLQAEERRTLSGTSKAPFELSIEFPDRESVLVQAVSKLKVTHLVRRIQAAINTRPEHVSNARLLIDGLEAAHGMQLGELGVDGKTEKKIHYTSDHMMAQI